MEKVSQEFLAYLAQNNNPVLNQKPLQSNDYNISFDLEGFHYEFSQENGYWKWEYYQK